jgi:hypothetical protein
MNSQYEVHLLTTTSGGVMGSMLASNAVDCWFEPPSGQTKDYKIGTWDFSAKHVAIGSKSKDRLARNKDNMSEWNDMSDYLWTVVSVS